MSENSRNNPRRSVLWSGKLSTGDYDFECHIWNISLGGARINTDAKIEKGTKLSLHTERYQPIEALVVWQGEDGIGLKFDAEEATIRKILGEESVATLGLLTDDQKGS